MAGEDELCSACERVDLYSLFTGPRDFTYVEPVTMAKIGTLQEIMSNKRCPLCRLVKHELDANDGDATRSWIFKATDVRDPAKARCILQPIRSDSSSEVRYLDDATQDLVSSALMIHVEEEGVVKPLLNLNKHGGHIKLLSPDSVDPNRPLLNGYLTSTMENGLDLLGKWLDGCIKYHEVTCQRPQVTEHTSQSLSIIQAIEVSTRNIVTISTSASNYATLSWVWGAGHEAYLSVTDKLVITKDSISLPAEDVPQLVEDAIYVCQRIAVPYLWVDLYFIHQRDPEVKAAEISAMGYIYHMSCITLVAAAGSTLLGHRSHSDYVGKQLKVETINGRRYVSTYNFWLGNCPWAERSWTYQEGQLATRIAVFDGAEVAFFCSSGQWRESAHSGTHGHDSNLPGINLRSQGTIILSASRWLELPSWSFDDYATIIVFYNGRDITYESDKVDAIRGCLNLMARRKDIEFFQGMPLTDFHYALLFNTEYGERRCDGFPSWSWAGWWALSLHYLFQPDGHDGARLVGRGDDDTLSYTSGLAADRQLSFFWEPKTSNRCSQQLAWLKISKTTSTVVVKSDVAHFTVEAFGRETFELRDGHGNILKDKEGGFWAHTPQFWQCGEPTKDRLRTGGIELVSIIKTFLVEGTSPLSVPLDHVLCLGINRETKNPEYVERWGMFIVPREMWEKTEPKEMTVELC